MWRKEKANAWEQRKLGDITSLITKGTTPKDKSGIGNVNFVKVENINSDNGEITGMSQISYEEHEGYLKRSQLMEDDILFSIAGTLGRATIVKSSILPANTNQALAIIRIKEGNLNYILTALKGKAVEDFIKRNPTVGAQPNLSLEQVGSLEIPFPSIEEQEQIGKYFSNLDHLITLHQRKLESVKQLKKTMLSKMFPKNGSNIPEIRFDGFTNAWEQRKLGEIVEKYENTIETPKNGYTRLGLRSHGKGTFHSYVQPEDALETGKMNVIAANKLILNITFAWEQAVAITDENDAGKLVSHRFPQFSFNEGMEPRFFKYAILNERFKKHLELSSPGGAGRNRVLKINEMLEYFFSIPNYQEQKKIGEYFATLDHLITLHQREVENYQKLKKTMLSKMFI